MGRAGRGPLLGRFFVCWARPGHTAPGGSRPDTRPTVPWGRPAVPWGHRHAIVTGRIHVRARRQKRLHDAGVAAAARPYQRTGIPESGVFKQSHGKVTVEVAIVSRGVR